MIWILTIGAACYLYWKTGKVLFSLGPAVGLVVYMLYWMVRNRMIFSHDNTSIADLHTPAIKVEKYVSALVIVVGTVFFWQWAFG